MAKGDGKKKRKKKSSAPSSSSSSTSSPSASQPQPQRVSTDINVPVRLQIRYGQMRKAAAAKQTGPSFRQKKLQRTKYRRSWDEEEIELKREERIRRGQDPDWDVILNRTAVSPLVIVDGYNIIHKWPRLKKHMNKGDAQRARQLLVDDLENLRSLKGWRIEVVFDGTGRSTVGPLGGGSRVRVTAEDQAEKKSVTKYGVRTVFTGVGVEADSYIQARCARARNVTGGETTGSFIVATDDSMIRLAGQSAGAFCMGAERFVDELKATKKAIDYRVEAAVAKVNGHAIRPAQLRGTHTHGFGRNQILIEDKRKRKRKKEEENEVSEEDDDLRIEIEVDENGVPWWAKIPNHTSPT